MDTCGMHSTCLSSSFRSVNSFWLCKEGQENEEKAIFTRGGKDGLQALFFPYPFFGKPLLRHLRSCSF